MNQRREDLSTADLAAQQPADTTPPDRAAAADVPGREPTDEELRREELAADERSRGTAVGEDRRLDQEPAAAPLARLTLRRPSRTANPDLVVEAPVAMADWAVLHDVISALAGPCGLHD